MNDRIIILCCCIFATCAVLLYIVSTLIRKKVKAFNNEEKKIGAMDIVLIFVGIALVVFTVEMIRIYREFGTEPTTLEVSVYGLLGGECGIMGWIKTTKERYRERKWQQEDKNCKGDLEDKHTTNDM